MESPELPDPGAGSTIPRVPDARRRAAARCGHVNHRHHRPKPAAHLQKHGVGRLGPEGWGLGVLFIAGNFKDRDVLNCQTGDPHTACSRPMNYWITRYGYTRYCPSGYYTENIAWGTGSLSTAREAVRWWVNSDKGHREALLDPQWTKHGMGLSSPGTYQGNPGAVVFVHYMCR